MKNVNKVLLSTVLSIGLIASANAHDPKMHMKKAEKADCSMMEKMDHDKMASKMKSKDPVMMAMMKKCMKQAKEAQEHEHNEGSEEHEHEHKEGAAEHDHH